PDEPLRKVQAACLQHRRVVAEVAVAAPNVKATSRQQHASEVSKPSMQQLLEFLFGNEIIAERSVLSPHLGNGGAGLLERGEAGSSGVVTARLDADVVRRVGVH